MATQKDYSFAGSLANINPAEQSPEAIEKYKATLEEQIGALERRYNEPNWFKVAAGFAKPQLGGFLASLGSASEAMAENVEQQREQQLPIAQMKAQIEQSNMLLGQKQKQNDIFQEWRASKKPMDEDTYTRIASLGVNTDVAQAAKQFYDQTQARLGAEAKAQGIVSGSLDIQQKILENPALIINDPTYTGARSATKEESDQYIKNLSAARPPGFTPTEWSTMTIPQKAEAFAEYANKKAITGMSEGEKFAFESGMAHNTLDELASLRTLAVDKDIAPLFSVGRSGDLFSQFRALVEKFGGNTSAAAEGMVAAARDRLKNASDETRAKADKLIKGIAELEVNMRGRLNNPTDAASTLSSARSPSLDNSQAGFVGILDQLGLNAYRDIGIGKLHNQLRSNGITAKDAAYSDELEKFRSETRKLRTQLASKYSLSSMPAWYDTRIQTARQEPAAPAAVAPQAAPAAPVAPVATVAPVAPTAPAAAVGTSPSNPAPIPAAPSMLERIRAEQQRRSQQQSRP